MKHSNEKFAPADRRTDRKKVPPTERTADLLADERLLSRKIRKSRGYVKQKRSRVLGGGYWCADVVIRANWELKKRQPALAGKNDRRDRHT